MLFMFPSTIWTLVVIFSWYYLFPTLWARIEPPVIGIVHLSNHYLQIEVFVLHVWALLNN
jgi:hypothetical protein